MAEILRAERTGQKHAGTSSASQRASVAAVGAADTEAGAAMASAIWALATLLGDCRGGRDRALTSRAAIRVQRIIELEVVDALLLQFFGRGG